jgi:hypothetical protein
MPRGDEDCRDDILSILSVDAMPGEHFILEMYSPRTVDNNGIGTGGHVGHFGAD